MRADVRAVCYAEETGPWVRRAAVAGAEKGEIEYEDGLGCAEELTNLGVDLARSKGAGLRLRWTIQLRRIMSTWLIELIGLMKVPL